MILGKSFIVQVKSFFQYVWKTALVNILDEKICVYEGGGSFGLGFNIGSG